MKQGLPTESHSMWIEKGQVGGRDAGEHGRIPYGPHFQDYHFIVCKDLPMEDLH